jgi:hypothetical protein
VKVTEHRYDPQPPVNIDKENSLLSSSSSSRLAPPPPHSAGLGIHSHTLGHRQIARQQEKNELHLKRQEILSRKRSDPPASDNDHNDEYPVSTNARVSLAKFKSIRPSVVAATAATQKRKDHDQLQRELARFDDKRRRVIILKPRPSGDSSTTTPRDAASTPLAGFSMTRRQATPHPNHQDAAAATTTASTPGLSARMTRQDTPHPNKGQVAAATPGLFLPLQGTPQQQPNQDAATATPGFSIPLHGTPHPNHDGPAANPTMSSFGAIASNVSTPEVQATTNTTVATPVPFATKPVVDTPHPNHKSTTTAVSFVDPTSTGYSTGPAKAMTGGPHAPAGSFGTTSSGTATTHASTPSFHFASSGNNTAVPSNTTPAPAFNGSTVTTTATPVTNHPTTAYPAPSFQFGSTAANTPQPGPVNGLTTTPTMPNVSFGSAVVHNAPTPSFANAPATQPSFGSQQSMANAAFGSAAPTAPTAFGTSNPSNPFGTSTGTNAPTPGAAAPSGSNPFVFASGSTSLVVGGAVVPTATMATAPVSFGLGAQANMPNAAFGNTVVASFGGSNPANPSFGGTQTTNGSNPFVASTAPASSFGGGGAAQNGGAIQFGTASASSNAANTFSAPSTAAMTGSNPFGGYTVAVGLAASSNQFGTTSSNSSNNTFGAPSTTTMTGSNPFGSSTSTNQFGTAASASNAPNAFGAPSTTLTGSNTFGGGGGAAPTGTNNPFMGGAPAAGGFSVGSNKPRGQPPRRNGARR